MPRFTAAYSRLIQRFKEVEILLRLAKQARDEPPQPATIARVNALCRSGVVLLSSHIEGYIQDLGEIALDRIVQRRVPKSNLGPGFRYYLSRDVISAIKKSEHPDKVVTNLDMLLQRDSHIWGSDSFFRQTLSPQAFFGGFSNPTHLQIKKLFRRFGYKEFQYDLQRLLRADFDPCSNMVNQVVDQRNKIAHGNPVITGTPSDLSDMIDLTKLYCRSVDQVVGNWFRDHSCTIR